VTVIKGATKINESAAQLLFSLLILSGLQKILS